ncbi:hypothetical protein CEXT_385201 [Caerostris extrusa]|uniref:Uncharacterized protein n=1 Tax=Caerostris extrusa TaxID=172846 RepID=A0AAV4UQ42_CAEEX|nr:hypothetical protein CEXT_385201 [Caerostris extrusa]
MHQPQLPISRPLECSRFPLWVRPPIHLEDLNQNHHFHLSFWQGGVLEEVVKEKERISECGFWFMMAFKPIDSRLVGEKGCVRLDLIDVDRNKRVCCSEKNRQ